MTYSTFSQILVYATLLESDVQSAIIWFDANGMKSNQSKCHFLLASTGLSEHIWIKAGDQTIWESSQEKLLGLSIDKQIKFDKHITNICKNARAKVTALSRMVKIVDERIHSIPVLVLPPCMDVLPLSQTEWKD